MEAFVEWLRAHNDDLPPEQRAGFFGLDLYSLNKSIRAVLDYLDRVDPEAAAVARRRYGCLAPWAKSDGELLEELVEVELSIGGFEAAAASSALPTRDEKPA